MQELPCLEELLIPECLQPIVFIQNTLIKLKTKCVSSFCEIIFNEPKFQSQEIIEKLGSEIIVTTKLRSGSIPPMISLVKHLFTNKKFKSILKSKILERAFIESSYAFLKALYEADAYQLYEIQEKIMQLRRFDFAFYFAKEIPIDYAKGWKIPSVLVPFIAKFDQLQKDNWYQFDYLRENSWEIGTIGDIIKHDDVDTLSSLASEPGFIIDGFIEYSPFEPLRMPRVTTYISLAAFYGSIQCFKFLYLNGAQLTENVINCAVASGCCEAIHICSQEKVIGGLEAAIEFRRNDVMNWLSLHDGDVDISASACLDWDNALVALYVSLFGDAQIEDSISDAMKELSEGRAKPMADIINPCFSISKIHSFSQ